MKTIVIKIPIEEGSDGDVKDLTRNLRYRVTDICNKNSDFVKTFDPKISLEEDAL